MSSCLGSVQASLSLSYILGQLTKLLSPFLTLSRGWFLKGGINYTRYNSYSRDKSAIPGITVPGIKMGFPKYYLSLE